MVEETILSSPPRPIGGSFESSNEKHIIMSFDVILISSSMARLLVSFAPAENGNRTSSFRVWLVVWIEDFPRWHVGDFEWRGECQT